MPTRIRADSKPSVEFDPQREISPFVLFRRLRNGQSIRLIDIRPDPDTRTLQGAEPWPGPEWQPDPDEDVLLFDEDGSKAYSLAESLQEQGFARCKALFGGLDLYEFALDPQVVGGDTYLVTSNS